jgi:hypothetical protein
MAEGSDSKRLDDEAWVLGRLLSRADERGGMTTASRPRGLGLLAFPSDFRKETIRQIF